MEQGVACLEICGYSISICAVSLASSLESKRNDNFGMPSDQKCTAFTPKSSGKRD
jgi:hypothetical protein